MDERDLIDRWRQGDSEAARTLVARYYRRMLNLFYRLTGTREQAEELSQDLFVRLTHQVVHRHDVITHVGSWLHRAALNLWRDHARRAIRAREKGITTAGGDEAILQFRAPNGVEDEVVSHWEREAVRHAILELSPVHREVVVLHHYQGLPYDQIAVVTEVPVGTVRSRLHYAMKQLRLRLESGGEGGIRP